jgi:membrane protease YdiL (CAAX protease family)
VDVKPAATRAIAPWQIGLVFFVAVVLELALAGAVGVVCGALAAARGEDPLSWLTAVPAIVVQVIAGSAMLAALAAIVPKVRGLAPGRALGLAAPRWNALAVAALGVLPMGILSDELTYGVGRAAPQLFDRFILEQFATTFADASGPWFVALTAAIAIGPALGEELLFRGLILGSLAAQLPRGLAVVLSAILFGAIHFDALQGLGALLVGLYLGFVVLATGSLWPAIAAHALNNLLCALFARFDPAGAGSAFDTGHPWPLVAASAVAVAAVIAALYRMRLVSPPLPQPLPDSGRGDWPSPGKIGGRGQSS